MDGDVMLADMGQVNSQLLLLMIVSNLEFRPSLVKIITCKLNG